MFFLTLRTSKVEKGTPEVKDPVHLWHMWQETWLLPLWFGIALSPAASCRSCCDLACISPAFATASVCALLASSHGMSSGRKAARRFGDS